MRCVCFAGLILVLAALAYAPRVCANVAGTEIVQVPLMRADTTLLGGSSSAEFAIALDHPAHRRSDPKLTLHWEISAVVERATLTIEVDDRPISSTALSVTKAAGRITASLGRFGAGFHVVRVRARLQSGPDPCRSIYDRELWLRILSASELRWSRTTSDSRPATIQGLLASWSVAGLEVAIVPPRKLGPDSAAAYLEADALARSLGLQPILGRSSEKQSAIKQSAIKQPAIILQSDASSADESALAQPAVLGLVRAGRASLQIAARSAAEVTSTLHALRNPTIRARCQEAVCLIPRPELHLPSIPQDAALSGAQNALPAGLVASLSAAGYPRGFTAHGEGSHLLRLVWQRPIGWSIETSPELDLEIQLSTSPDLDRAASSLTVRMGDRPLLSWSPAQALDGPMRVKARIPRELWTQEAWSFELDISLRTIDAARCRADSGTLWLSLSSDSGLVVPRRESRSADSLARFQELARAHQPVLVMPPELTWSALEALAVVVTRLAAERPWTWVSSLAECGELCIVPHLGEAAEDAELQLISVGGALRWFDRSGALALPLLPARSGIWVRRHAGAAGACEQLEVTLPAGFASEGKLPPLDYERHQSAQALLSDGAWLALGSTPRAAVSAPAKTAQQAASASGAAKVDSRTQIRSRWMDAGWLTLGTLFAAGSLWLTRRRRAPAQPAKSAS